MIVASETAVFGMPEITLGIIPGAGGTQRLPRLIGPHRAKETIFTGSFYDVNACREMGLVNKVVPVERLMEEAKELARRCIRNGAVALACAKACVNEGMNTDLYTGLAYERKCFISNGGIADLSTVYASTDPGKGTRGLSCFLIPKGTPGISGGKKERKMGVRASVTSEVILSDCRVPVENRLGEEGQGFKIAMITLDKARVSVASNSVGIARAALEAAVDYARQRVQFGRPIIENQAIQFMLADMDMEIEAGRLLYLKAAWLETQGMPFTREAAMAKTFCSDMAMRVTTDVVQVFGGYGYMRDYPVEKLMRDAKINQIWDGTNQIQRIVMARSLLGR